MTIVTKWDGTPDGTPVSKNLPGIWLNWKALIGKDRTFRKKSQGFGRLREIWRQWSYQAVGIVRRQYIL